MQPFFGTVTETEDSLARLPRMVTSGTRQKEEGGRHHGAHRQSEGDRDKSASTDLIH